MNIAQVDYDGLIPNNVALGQDARVKRALEKWHPGYLDWWNDMGPEGFQESLVYLRTAISVDPKGWAKFDYVQHAGIPLGHPARAAGRGPQHPVRRPQGRAGLAGGAGRISRDAAPPDRHPGRYRARLGRAAAPSRQDRAVALRHAQPVPGQCRRRPPSVGDGLSAAEIFRHATAARRRKTCCSAAPATPTRRACSAPSTRQTPDWLSFFMFTFFTDRDGKMQLEALAQSGFDPLSRTCRFMLTEEAHHMFVGETGVGRIDRSAPARRCVQAGIDDPHDIDAVRRSA